MSGITIVTAQFDKHNDNYEILLNVFLHSIERNMPGTKTVVLRGNYPRRQDKRLPLGYTANAKKLEYWVDELDNVRGNIIFMDCDMVVTGDMGQAFQEDFDIAYTFRNPDKVSYPINGGVVFARTNQRTTNFFRKWLEIDKKMYHNHNFHTQYRSKYRGMNQASFGWMIENYDGSIDLSKLPCQKWNVCDEDWNVIDKNCLCIHVKNKLRKTCLAFANDKDYSSFFQPKMKKGFDLWTEYFKEMIIKDD